MKKPNLLWRWILLAVLACASIWLVLDLKLPLGIDLSGGFRFVLGVDYAALATEEGREISAQDRERAQGQALEVLRNRIDSAGTREAVIYKEDSGRIVFEIPGVGEDQRKELEDLIKRPAYLEFRLVHEDNARLSQQLLLSNTELPGYKRVTVDGSTYFQKDPAFPGAYDAENRAVIARAAPVSPLYEVLLEELSVQNYGSLFRPVYVQITPELDGTAIRFARPDYDQYNRVQVALEFNDEGSKRFYRITRDYVAGGLKNPGENGRRLAIVMDDTLYSAPTLNAVISGSAVIEGSFTYEEASKISNALNSGSLPVPIVVETVQQVEPTLGRAAIHQGVTAAVVGLAVVLVFMLAYYRLAGLIANLGLLLDAVLMPLGMYVAAGFLGIFGDGGGAGAQNINQLPTLTLPGIAGLVLTIGMAVDANVLIYERIREEQLAGKRLLSAIQAGFAKAFSTIFDANITTLLVAVILFMQGSGPIRGFAVMLTAGILVSMYSALVFTRMGFDSLVRLGIDRVKMLSLVPDTLRIDFLGKQKAAFLFSALVILGSMGFVGYKGREVLGIDFTGGSALLYHYNADKASRPSDSEIRDLLAPLGVKEAIIQYQDLVTGEDGATQNMLQLRLDAQYAEPAKIELEKAYGEKFGFSLRSEETIGAQVSKELKTRGLTAILFALVGIVIYITARFEFGFAIGTIVALAHDVLFTVGLYCLFGRQLSLPIVAALLTIVGYSANDTIVVFDRIREDLQLVKGKSYRDIANLSINQTLSRTVLTSLTTLFTVVALLIFGGGAILDFALALCIGIVVGTYSTVFIATPVALLWHRDEKTAKA